MQWSQNNERGGKVTSEYPTVKFFLTQILFAGIIVMAFSLQSYAQTAAEPGGIIEKSLEQSRPTFAPPPEEKPPEIIIEDSRKLEDPGAGPTFFVKKVIIEGNTLIDDATLAPLVDVEGGMDLTLGILALMANEITAFYATEGYFLTRAFVPQQELIDGTVKIQVSEGRVGNVTIKGNKRYDSKDFLEWMKLVQGEPVLREQTLEETLKQLNSFLGVNVRSILRPGELPGTSDLVLDVTESSPYLFSYDMDNFGSNYTGENRFGFNGTVGSVFTLGDQFSMRFLTTDMTMSSYSPSYIVPVNHLGTRFRLAYTFSENELGRGLKNQSAGGNSHSYTLELSHPLSMVRDSQMNVRGGINVLVLENENLKDRKITTKETLQNLYFGLGGNFTDNYLGRNFYDLKLQRGLRLMPTYLRTPSRDGGNNDAFIAVLNLTRIQKTQFFKSYFTIKFNGQVTDKRVLSSGKKLVGGMGSVRGYTLAEVSGDMGYNTSIDYTIPFPKPIKLFKDFPTLDQILSFNMFVDYAKVFTRDKLDADSPDDEISGYGVGVTLNVPKKQGKYPGFSFALSYAQPVPGMDEPARSTGGFGPSKPIPTPRGTVYLSSMIRY